MVINYILILMKSYIFSDKNRHESLNIEIFKKALSMKIKLEEIIAFERNKIDLHKNQRQKFVTL